MPIGTQASGLSSDANASICGRGCLCVIIIQFSLRIFPGGNPIKKDALIGTRWHGCTSVGYGTGANFTLTAAAATPAAAPATLAATASAAPGAPASAPVPTPMFTKLLPELGILV